MTKQRTELLQRDKDDLTPKKPDDFLRFTNESIAKAEVLKRQAEAMQAEWDNHSHFTNQTVTDITIIK